MLAVNVKHRIVVTQIVEIPDLHRMDRLEQETSNQWKVTAGVLTYKRMILVVKDDLLCNKVIRSFNDNPEPATLKLPKLLSCYHSIYTDLKWTLLSENSSPTPNYGTESGHLGIPPPHNHAATIPGRTMEWRDASLRHGPP